MTTGNNVLSFDFRGTSVRVVERDGAPWFVVLDVARALGVQNATDLVARLDPDERALDTIEDTSGRRQPLTVVTESGLYELVLTGRKPQARAFKRWVRHDVLPAVRREGRYGAPQAFAELGIEGLQSELRSEISRAVETALEGAVNDSHYFLQERLERIEGRIENLEASTKADATALADLIAVTAKAVPLPRPTPLDIKQTFCRHEADDFVLVPHSVQWPTGDRLPKPPPGYRALPRTKYRGTECEMNARHRDLFPEFKRHR